MRYDGFISLPSIPIKLVSKTWFAAAIHLFASGEINESFQGFGSF